MKIGVFDSGKGGAAVAEELQRHLPNAEILSANDSAHVPYGGRPRHEIISLTKAALQPLLAAQCDAIVIACNTITTTAIQVLRAEFPTQKFVGLEPMVKPAAALTKTKTIAVLATSATLASPRYQQLKSEWASGITVLEPDCSTWAAAIEHDAIETLPVKEVINEVVAQGADVIVLACTHYHWLKQDIEAIAGPTVAVLEPSQAIKNRIVDIVQPAI